MSGKRETKLITKSLSSPLPLQFSLKICEESSDSYFIFVSWLGWFGYVLAGLFFSQIS